MGNNYNNTTTTTMKHQPRSLHALDMHFLQITQSYILSSLKHLHTLSHIHAHTRTKFSIVMFSSRFDINAAGWLVQSTFDDIGIQQKTNKTNVIMTSLFATL